MGLSNFIWYFRLGVDFNSGRMLSGHRKLYACKDGSLIIHPCGTAQYIKNTWYDEETLKEILR